MSQAKRPSKRKYPSKAISVLGVAGISFAASAEGSVADIAPISTVPSHLLAFGDEEISDVSLATFHGFDNENFAKPQSGLIQMARGGCGCGRGCAAAEAVGAAAAAGAAAAEAVAPGEAAGLQGRRLERLRMGRLRWLRSWGWGYCISRGGRHLPGGAVSDC